MHRGLVGEGRGEDQAQPDQGGREPFLQPVPPYPGTDPLELPRHALEIIDRRSHPLPPFEALAGLLPPHLDPPRRLPRDPPRPRPPPPLQQAARTPPGIARGGGCGPPTVWSSATAWPNRCPHPRRWRASCAISWTSAGDGCAIPSAPACRIASSRTR